jgi:predicted DNA binding CopG/RHH family protein
MKNKKSKLPNKKKTDADPVERDFSFIFDSPQDWLRLKELIKHLPKDKTITLRLSSNLLDQYKKLAEEQDTKYQKLIHEALIEYLAKKAS